MTHDRFLLLKGIEILGYAREFPAGAKLPFYGLANIPSPKTVVPLDRIKNVTVEEDKLIVRHADASNTVWEFICPSKRCAIEWNQKIQEAIILLREFESSGFGSPAEFYQFRAGGLGSRNSPPPPPKIESYPHSFNTNIESSPPRFNTNFNSSPPVNSSPPRVETNINYRVNHDDEVSRSVFDNSGPKVNQAKFGEVNYNVNSSPVKTNQYEVNYQVNQVNQQIPPQTVGMNVNANYQNQAQNSYGSTNNSSGRSFTVSSSSSFGRYPMGMPMGQQPPVMQGRSGRNM